MKTSWKLLIAFGIATLIVIIVSAIILGPAIA
jgi:hypothetical protein